MSKINLREKLAKFSDHWSPKVIAEMNDYQFKLVKIKGDFVWHNHVTSRTKQSSWARARCMSFRRESSTSRMPRKSVR